MEQSQVRWAILLSRAPLKVRRLHSLPLLWAAAGPDCRSLKLYWVSAKALTLPISQHASSQLSLPSGLRPSPERINISSLCSRYARAMRLLKSWAPSILTLSLFWAHVMPFSHTDWRLGVYCPCDFAEWCSSSKQHYFCSLRSNPPTPNHRRIALARCHLSNPSPSVATPERVQAREGVMEGFRASDRSAGATQQVRRCEAEPNDGLINPATPPFQREVVTWKLETVQRKRS